MMSTLLRGVNTVEIKMLTGEVIVVSSINEDISVTVHRQPRAGETLRTKSTKRSLGGKGANVAVAAAKCGGARSVRLLGAVGKNGTALLEALRSYRVDVSGVTIDDSCDSGTAIVIVDEGSGENRILYSAGANARLTVDGVWDGVGGSEISRVSVSGAVVVLQLEVDYQVTESVARGMSERGAIVVLNPSPVATGELGERLFGAQAAVWKCLDVVIVNLVELGQLCGDDQVDVEQGIEHMRARCAARTRIVVTLGSSGVAYSTEGAGVSYVAALKVERVVDTTGAGDTFTGSLCARMSAGAAFDECVKFAVVAAGMCVQAHGAAESIADEEAVKKRAQGIF